VEAGDAGSDLSHAQVITGIGVPRTISGSLASSFLGADYEDLYVIRVLQPSLFSFKLQPTTFNSQLYLFGIADKSDLYGLLSNDDQSLTSTAASISQSNATDGTGARIIYPGQYCLAITVSGRYPVSASGAIFYQASPTEISGPDGPGRYDPLTGWEGTGDTGSYTVDVTGVGFVDGPAPGALSLAGLAGAAALRRRR
jgi:MYXO-CTERM domain-containing protein